MGTSGGMLYSYITNNSNNENEDGKKESKSNVVMMGRILKQHEGFREHRKWMRRIRTRDSKRKILSSLLELLQKRKIGGFSYDISHTLR